MRKKLYLLIIVLFVCFKMEAQDQYYFQFNLNIEYAPSCSNQTQDGETIDVSILDENNRVITNYGIDLVNLPLSYNNGNEVYTFVSEITTLNERPYRITADYTAYCEGAGGSANAFNSDLVFNHGSFHDYDIQSTNTGLGIYTSIDATISPVLSTPHTSPICPNELIFNDTEASEFVYGLTWLFLNSNNQWEELNNYSDYYPLKFTIENVFGPDYLSNPNSNTLQLMYRYKYNSSSKEIESNPIIVDVIGCSPTLINTTKSDETCFDKKDGSVTLTFESDIDSDSDMRYYIYQKPAGATNVEDAFSGDPEAQNPPQAYAEVRLGSLNDNNNGTYSGTSNLGDIISGDGNLEAGDYYILYQEVKYNNGIATVKSGELTPNFINITSPSQVITNSSFTPSTCGNDALIEMSPTGGNNTNGYFYQYSTDNGTSWIPTTNQLYVTPSANPQVINVRALSTVNSCKGTEVQYTIAASTPQLSIVGTPTFVPPTTDSNTDGSIRIEIQNGSPNYIYELNRLNTNTNSFENIETVTSSLKLIDFSNITIGTYNIVVTDDLGCIKTSNTIIVTKEPIPNIVGDTPQQITCFNSANGQVSATVSDFGTNYKYQWFLDTTALDAPQNSSSNTQSLSNLNVGGTYVLRVGSSRLSDADFGIVENYNEVTFSLDNPTQVAINTTPTPTNASCNSGADGSIALDLSGGTSYQYSFNATDWTDFNGTNITGLSFGSYSLTIRNQNGCESQTVTVLIDQPDALIVTEDASLRQDVTANAGSNGAIFINEPIGGTAPYEYTWSGTLISDGSSYSNTTKNIENLFAGTYTLTVTDDQGCSITLPSIEITEPGPLAVDNPPAIVTPILCFGETTGRIDAQYEGTPEFTFVWYNQNGDALKTGTDDFIDNLSAGDYYYTIDDATDAAMLTSAIITIDPAPEVINATITANGTCLGFQTGAITFSNVTGGTLITGENYTYTITNNDTGDAFTNTAPAPFTFDTLQAATYTAVVEDSNNCQLINNSVSVVTFPVITWDEPNTITFNISESGKTDGVISPVFTGGAPPFSYSWSGPNGFTETTKDITNLEEGIYTVTVTDTNFCTTSQSFNITEPGELVVTIEQVGASACNGDNSGALEAKAEGGILNYTYQWFQSVNGNDIVLDNEDSFLITDLQPGAYFARVTDANGIVKNSNTIQIIEPDILEATLVTKTDVLCNGEQTGAIEITVAGGTEPYELYWNQELSTQNLNNLPAGQYSFLVVDANDCSDTLEVTIQGPANPLAIENLIVTNASEYQATDGNISLEIIGGAPDYTITWTRLSDNTVISDQTTITNLTADEYQINITDTNGCSLTEVYTITQPDIVEETIIAPSCTGGDDGSISLLVNKGNGNFTYSWNTGSTSNSITNLTAGEYTVTITGFDTPLTRTYIIEDPLPINIDLGGDRVLCKEQSLELDATVENPNASYAWTSDNGFTSTTPNVVLFEKGNYTLTIQNENGCTTTAAIFVDVTSEEISAEFAASSQVYVNENLILVDISYPLPDSMEWIIPENATVINSSTDEAEIRFDTPGEYEVGIITQRGPCTDIQTKKVIVVANDPTVTQQDTENGKKLVEDFLIYPNPTTGKFNAKVTLTEKGNISIKIFSLNNNSLIASENQRGEALYDIPFDISNMPAGVYAVLLETPYGNTLRKVIVK
ncbi:T9SS type A sorting domain-containing protein [Cellulophaga sp. HaHaR_3_176]|uniref:T9SS type A sorting domain-containing protein n=1 Tax=Cellulophaga sp. HaHaR_3_176 TaxID=1942464 RepID=UPI001C1F60FE|nr:T9SS type A sorting domain-containing protein [Cellulophaga sp. HaHaR_3_176]QWX83315.1 T9SS type A sorting domain-containing protein [Cellulophaga sp. HaHaR_3_176]